MNLSETAFLVAGDDGWDLRWFTPVTEVELCGHATLASAHLLWEEGKLERTEEARFHTKSGLLTAAARDDRIELDFPARPEKPAPIPAGLERALGVPPAYVGRSKHDLLVEVDSERTLRDLTPDVALLSRLPVRGVCVTARSSSAEYDFVSRFFAPRAGINEDPVTGSAHCCLGPYWQPRLRKTEFTAYQASARGGVVHVRVCDDRVLLGGNAVTVLRGRLEGPAAEGREEGAGREKGMGRKEPARREKRAGHAS